MSQPNINISIDSPFLIEALNWITRDDRATTADFTIDSFSRRVSTQWTVNKEKGRTMEINFQTLLWCWFCWSWSFKIWAQNWPSPARGVFTILCWFSFLARVSWIHSSSSPLSFTECFFRVKSHAAGKDDAHATIWTVQARHTRERQEKNPESNEECFFGIFFSTSHVVCRRRRQYNEKKDDELAIFHRLSRPKGGLVGLTCQTQLSRRPSVAPSREFLHLMKISLWSHLRRLQWFLWFESLQNFWQNLLIKSKFSC